MAQMSARVVRDENVMGGTPVIEGTRITVTRIHQLVNERGLPAEEVGLMHDLDPDAVRAALRYYEENPDVIEDVERRRARLERLARENGAKTIEELVAERDG
jgi:uncharacterized protein (DUF433 family)